jgi:hypothetical protein
MARSLDGLQAPNNGRPVRLWDVGVAGPRPDLLRWGSILLPGLEWFCLLQVWCVCFSVSMDRAETDQTLALEIAETRRQP